MQRETLFRGKEIKTGKWVYGGFHEHKPSIVAIGKQPETEALIIEDGNADWNLPVPIKAYVVEKKTVGEFTGLTDKNGVNIFAGDILREYDGFTEHIILIRWDNEHCGFVYDFIPPKHAPHEGVMTLSLYHFCSDEHEIIGNVHDAPELWPGNKEE
jgi:uncharacterized phage protein (TIGR01671 family)